MARRTNKRDVHRLGVSSQHGSPSFLRRSGEAPHIHHGIAGSQERDEDAAAEDVLTKEEVAAGYRLLCGAILCQTARLLSEFGADGRGITRPHGPKRQKYRQYYGYADEISDQRRVAGRWLDEGGTITFAECCAELGLDEDVARVKVRDYASSSIARYTSSPGCKSTLDDQP
jgi:hypothetical protein